MNVGFIYTFRDRVKIRLNRSNEILKNNIPKA